MNVVFLICLCAAFLGTRSAGAENARLKRTNSVLIQALRELAVGGRSDTEKAVGSKGQCTAKSSSEKAVGYVTGNNLIGQGGRDQWLPAGATYDKDNGVGCDNHYECQSGFCKYTHEVVYDPEDCVISRDCSLHPAACPIEFDYGGWSCDLQRIGDYCEADVDCDSWNCEGLACAPSNKKWEDEIEKYDDQRLARGFYCNIMFGDGDGSESVVAEGVDNLMDCAELVAKADPNANGATWGTINRKCYKEVGMQKINHKATKWMSCFLRKFTAN